MSEFSPMLIVLLIPFSLLILGVGRVVLDTLLSYSRRAEPLDAPRTILPREGTPQLIATRTRAPRGRYALRALPAGRLHRLPQLGCVVVGRRPRAMEDAIVIDAEDVSGEHAEIEVRGSGIRIKNLSRFGTWVNDRLLIGEEEVSLNPGDQVRLGGQLYACEEFWPEAGASEASPRDSVAVGAGDGRGDACVAPTDPDRRAGARDVPDSRDGRDSRDGDDGIRVHWVRR